MENFAEVIAEMKLEIETLKEINEKLAMENAWLREQLGIKTALKIKEHKMITKSTLEEIFNIKRFEITDIELIPGKRVKGGLGRNISSLEGALEYQIKYTDCPKMSEIVENGDLYLAIKFFGGNINGREKVAALSIVLVEHYYSMNFTLPDNYLVWGSRPVNEVKWYSAVTTYMEKYKQSIIFKD